MRDDTSKAELLRKYRFAGKIRLISFSLLFFYLLLIKCTGGYSYINAAFFAVIVFETILNQPYDFIIQRVNIYRFQYYQMTVDIIAISWMVYHMGGIETPVVTLAYYAVILWAGVVSSTHAVFFSVGLTTLLFSLVVILEYSGFLPFTGYSHYKMPTLQMISILTGNIAFFFAFGYFSARAALVIKSLQRKRYEDSLKHEHRLRAIGHLVDYTAHDVVNHLANISGYTVLLRKKNGAPDEEEMVKSIGALTQESTNLLSRLMHFSKKPSTLLEPVSINGAIQDAIELILPLVRYSKITIEKRLDPANPLVVGEKDRLQEIFVALILNAYEAMPGKGTLVISTAFADKQDSIKIVVSDTGSGIQTQDMSRIRNRELFFTTKEGERKLGLGLVTAYEAVARHGGTIDIQSTAGKGTAFVIQLPVLQKETK
jgi:signal transduction histidine kinase